MTHQADKDGWQGKGVSPEQAAKIELAVLRACEQETTGIFHRDLTEGCASVGWGPFDPMTLWTIAVHADVYPVSYGQQQERTFNSGVWPLLTTKLVGFKSWDWQADAWSSTISDLSELGRNGEFTVCRLAMHERG